MLFPGGGGEEILGGAAIQVVVARIEDVDSLGQDHAGAVEEVAGPEAKIVDPLVEREAGGPFAEDHLECDVVVVERGPPSDQDVVVRTAEQAIVPKSTNENVQAHAADQLIVARVG